MKRPRDKLIRNLRAGDEIELTDATRHPPVRHRVRVSHVQETRRCWFTGRRQWQAFFTPHLFFGSWTHIHGEANDKITVYQSAPAD
jgi:hypothetical protein